MFHHSSDSSEGFTALRRHDEYYLSGGDLFFLIEQNHFRVHRYFFERESPFFKAQLATPASPGAPRQGTSESTAIVLDNVKSADFAKFLWVFYNPKYSLYKATVEDWVAILELATRWGFQEVKNLVVRELQRLEMSDLDRIVVYHKYDIDRGLLIPCYAALCEREAPLSLEEGMALGMDTTLKIFRAREVARALPAADGTRSPAPIVIPPPEMKGIVKDLFEVEEPPAASLDDVSAMVPPSKPTSSKTSPSKAPPTPKKPSASSKTSTTAADSTSTQKTTEKTESASSKKPETSSDAKSDTKPASTGGLVARILSAAFSTSVTPAVPTAPPLLKTPSTMELSPLQLSPLPLPMQPLREVPRADLLETEPQIPIKKALSPRTPHLPKEEEDQERKPVPGVVDSGLVDGVDGEDGSYRTLGSESDDETRVGSCSGDNEHDVFHDQPNESYEAPKNGLGNESYITRVLLQELDDKTRGVGGPSIVDSTETALDAVHGQSEDTDVDAPSDEPAEPTVARPVEADDTDQTSYGPSDEINGAMNAGIVDHQSIANYVSDVALDAVSYTFINPENSWSNDGTLLNDSSVSAGNALETDQIADQKTEGDGLEAQVKDLGLGEAPREEMPVLLVEGTAVLSSEDTYSASGNKTSEDSRIWSSDNTTLLKGSPSDIPDGEQDSPSGETDSIGRNASSGDLPSLSSDVNGDVVNGTQGPSHSTTEGPAFSDPLQSAPPLDGTTQAASPEASTNWGLGANFSFPVFDLSDSFAPTGECGQASEPPSQPVTDYLNPFRDFVDGFTSSETLPSPLEPAIGSALLGDSTADTKEPASPPSGEESSTASQSSVESQDVLSSTNPSSQSETVTNAQTNDDLEHQQMTSLSQSTEETPGCSAAPPEGQGAPVPVTDCPPQPDSMTGVAQGGNSVQTEEPTVPEVSGDDSALSQELSEAEGSTASSHSGSAACEQMNNTAAQAEGSTSLATGEGLPSRTLEKPTLSIDTTLAPQPDPPTSDQANGTVQTEGIILEPTGDESNPFENPFEAQSASHDTALPTQSEDVNVDQASDNLDPAFEETFGAQSDTNAQFLSDPTTNDEQMSGGATQTGEPTVQPDCNSEPSQKPSESEDPLDNAAATPQVEPKAGDDQTSDVPQTTSSDSESSQMSSESQKLSDDFAPVSQTESEGDTQESSISTQPENAIPQPTNIEFGLTESPFEIQTSPNDMGSLPSAEGVSDNGGDGKGEIPAGTASNTTNDVVSGTEGGASNLEISAASDPNGNEVIDHTLQNSDAAAAADNLASTSPAQTATDADVADSGADVTIDPGKGGGGGAEADNHDAVDGPGDAAIDAGLHASNMGAGTDVPDESSGINTSGHSIDPSALTVETEAPTVTHPISPTAGSGDNAENNKGAKTTAAQAVLDLDMSMFDDESDENEEYYDSPEAPDTKSSFY